MASTSEQSWQAVPHIPQSENQPQAQPRSDPIHLQTFEQLQDPNRSHPQNICHDQPQSEPQGQSYQPPLLDSENNQQPPTISQTATPSELSQEITLCRQEEVQHPEQNCALYGSVTAPPTSSSTTSHGTQVFHQVSVKILKSGFIPFYLEPPFENFPVSTDISNASCWCCCRRYEWNARRLRWHFHSGVSSG